MTMSTTTTFKIPEQPAPAALRRRSLSPSPVSNRSAVGPRQRCTSTPPIITTVLHPTASQKVSAPALKTPPAASLKRQRPALSRPTISPVAPKRPKVSILRLPVQTAQGRAKPTKSTEDGDSDYVVSSSGSDSEADSDAAEGLDDSDEEVVNGVVARPQNIQLSETEKLHQAVLLRTLAMRSSLPVTVKELLEVVRSENLEIGSERAAEASWTIRAMEDAKARNRIKRLLIASRITTMDGLKGNPTIHYHPNKDTNLERRKLWESSKRPRRL